MFNDMCLYTVNLLNYKDNIKAIMVYTMNDRNVIIVIETNFSHTGYAHGRISTSQRISHQIRFGCGLFKTQF